MASAENGYKGEHVAPGLFWFQVDAGPKVEARADKGTWIMVADARAPHDVMLFKRDRAIQKLRITLRAGEVLGFAYGGGIGTYAYAPPGTGCSD
jgi:hypothetical protein